MSKVVYIHRKKTNHEIFYVGLGDAKRPYNKNKRSISWMNTYKKHGRYVEVLYTELSLEDACDIEMDLIELIGRRDLGLGTLVNMTNGGEGTQGFEPWNKGKEMDQSYKDNIKKFHKGMTGKKMSTEHKKKVGAHHLGDKNFNSKKVVNIDTGIEYDTITEACNALGYNRSTIAAQLRGQNRIKSNNKLRYII